MLSTGVLDKILDIVLEQGESIILLLDPRTPYF